MAMAEFDLQLHPIAGNASPTFHQTLVRLADLYANEKEDKEHWRVIIESHPRVLIHFLRAIKPDRLETWDQQTELATLRHLTLVLLNQGARPDDAGEYQNRYMGTFAGRIAARLAPVIERRARLTARLVDTRFESNEEDVLQALRHHARPLDELHDTRLLTRIVAVAHHLSRDHADVDACARLLEIPSSDLQHIAGHMVSAPETTDNTAELSEKVMLINLQAATQQLADATSRETAVTQIASTLFDTPWVRTFVQTSTGWSDGNEELTSSHSLIARAAAQGSTLPSPSQQLTVIDEEIIASMGAPDVLAVPVFMNQDPDSCSAVILIGLTKTRLMELAGQNHLIDGFQQVVRSLFSAQSAPSIALDEFNVVAREIIHEANNPLSTVQNYLKVLALKLGPDHEALNTIDTISVELQRAGNIIQRFVELDPVRSINTNSSNVNQILMDQSSLFGSSMEIITELDLADPVAMIDSDILKQIVSNLMKNAGEAGATQLSLRTSAGLQQQDRTFVEIVIADNGSGITTDQNIFQRGVSTKSGDFSGQGLAVVKNLTDEADGIVSFRTSTHGTEFRIAIPEFTNRPDQ